MWTRKAILMIVLAIALLFVGLMARSLQLIATTIAIFSVATLSVFLNTQSKLKPRRKTSNEKIFEGGRVNVQLKLKNEGLKSGFVEVSDNLPEVMEVTDGSNYTYVNLKPRSETTMRYTVKTPIKGVYDLGPVRLRSHDPFNLFYKEQKVEYETTLTVFPRTDDIKHLKIKSKQPKMYPGEVRVKMPGPGAEFFSIREYHPGDPFKDINWKAYGKRGELLVNEHERESVSDVTIVLDAREASSYGTTAANPHIYGARCAATLTNFFLGRRDSVGLVVYGDKVLSIKKGTGKKQLFEILTGIAQAEPAGSIPLKGIVEEVIPFMPRKSPVIIISPLEDDETIRRAVSEMCVLEFDVTVLSPNSIEFEQLAQEREKEVGEKGLFGRKKRVKDVDPVAYDVLKLERDILINELRGYGVRVVDWRPHQPISQMLLQAENY